MNKKFIFINENGDPYPEWEQKKLGDFLSKYTDTTIHVEDDKSYSQLTVSKNTGVSKRGDILGAQIGRKRQFVVDTNKYPNTLTFTRQTVMDGGIGFIGHELNGFIATENMPLLSLDTSKCKKEFLNQYIGSDSYYEKVIFPIKPTGSAQIALHEKDWLAQVIPFPSLVEQEKIAEFFSALDERIALTADKVELLKEQKAGYLQKIFAQEMVFTDDNGGSYPEWEQKKLGEVADFINGFAFKPDHLGNEGTPVVKIKELLDPSDLSVKTTIDVPKSLHLKNGDIIFSWSMTLACRIWNGGPAFLNQHLYKVVVKEDCDSEFLNHLMNNELSELRNLMHGGTAKHITRKDLLPYKVMIPSLPEQLKIAEFFSTLDEQIELTENKLTLLKEQKKGYLQGIFG